MNIIISEQKMEAIIRAAVNDALDELEPEFKELKRAWSRGIARRNKRKVVARIRYATYQRGIEYDPDVMTELEFMRRKGSPYGCSKCLTPWFI